MSKSAVIIDTGPLVAFLVRTDLHHAWADREFQSLPKPFVTCEPVLAESAFLLSRLAHGPRRLFDLLEAGALTVQFSVAKERVALRKLMDKYADLPISLADACLIRLAELIPTGRVFTTDSDFTIYRKNGRQAIPVIAPNR